MAQQISPRDTKTQSKCGCFSGLHIIVFNCAFVAVNCLLPALPSNTLLEPEGGVGQKESVGGYDCKFAEQPTSAFQTECPVCRMILRDPYQSKCCGKSFCHSCSKKIQAEHKPCPTCRKDNFEIFEDKGMKQSLSQLYVLCTHSKDGCKWKGELGELEHHMIEVIHPGKFFIPT